MADTVHMNDVSPAIVHLEEEYLEDEEEAAARATPNDDVAWASEANRIFKLAVPLFFDYVSQVGFAFTDTLFLGHVGSTELAAAAIAVAWTLTTMYLFSGIAFGLDSVVSQAHGAKNMRLVDRAFQTCLLLSIVGSIPVMISYYYTEETLLLLGQLPDVARLAGVYAKWLIAGVTPAMITRASIRYLQMRGIVHPPMVAGMVALVINIILNTVLIFGVGSWGGLGFLGASLATTLSRCFHLVAVWGYMWIFKPKQFKWTGWHLDAVTPTVVGEFLRLGVPASLMFWLEETSFNLMTILIGLLHSKTATVASAICLSCLVFSFVFPISFGSAAAQRIGFLLGAGKPWAARSVSRFANKAALVLLFVNAIVLLVFRRGVINLFLAKEEQTDEIVKLSMNLLTILAVTFYMDGQQIVAGSLIRGAGFPTAGFVTNLIAHYVITNPLGALLAFVVGIGVYGFYVGLTVGLAVAGIMYVVFLWRLDWEKASRDAVEAYGLDHQAKEPGSSPQSRVHEMVVVDAENANSGWFASGRDFVPEDA